MNAVHPGNGPKSYRVRAYAGGHELQKLRFPLLHMTELEKGNYPLRNVFYVKCIFPSPNNRESAVIFGYEVINKVLPLAAI